MKVWMIWIQGDEATWLEAAWDEEMIVSNHEGWIKEVERCRKLTYDNKYEMRTQAVVVPDIYDLFEIPEVKAKVSS